MSTKYRDDGYQRDGRTKNKHFRRYMAMIQRCYYSNMPNYHDYGGRGIRVCARWLIDFWAYVEDVNALGEQPDGFTLDRIDVDGHYDPRNIRWASLSDQQLNKRPSYYFLTEDEKLEMFRMRDLVYQARKRSERKGEVFYTYPPK